MMTPKSRHPADSVGARKTGFGFDSIMAQLDRGQFRQWYDRKSFLPTSDNRAA